MNFTTDSQTLNDLNLLGKYKLNSIISLFNKTITSGAERLLENMFRNPLTQYDQINKRKDILSFFHNHNFELPFNKQEFEIIENYLMNAESKNKLTAAINISQLKLLSLIAKEKEYDLLKQGLLLTLNKFLELKDLTILIQKISQETAYAETINKLVEILDCKQLNQCYNFLTKGALKFNHILKIDYILRAELVEKIELLLNYLYELDVYITVAKVANENNFIYANALDSSEHVVDIKGVYHPYVPNPVSNDVFIKSDKNVLFLTGANMAGKSTFMKSFAVAIYLAHMGFPVAAKSMTFSLHDGIYTSINVPDDITKGYSHFYAEVLRVKKVAEEVASNKNLIIIFDELFKGTNVKDAYDGTYAITDALSQRKGMFIISTHIMEVGEALRKNNKKTMFKYLPTVMQGSVPTYTYKLSDGITDDRQGMIIIKNEGILEMINGKESKI